MEKGLVSREDMERLLHRVQRHLSDEVDVELGRFEVEALVEFIATLIGPQLLQQGPAGCAGARCRQVDQINECDFTRWSDCRALITSSSNLEGMLGAGKVRPSPLPHSPKPPCR